MKRFSIIRNLVSCYALILVGFFLACLAALYVLELAVGQVNQSPAAEETIRVLRYGQLGMLGLMAAGLLAGLVAMVLAGYQAIRVLERLRQATHQLADAVLDGESQHDTTVVADDLEDEIRAMIGKIKASQQLYLDASPLTRLPGNIAIEQVLKTKMEQGENFALCYIDLDDFKAYNDRYGYAKGSELIKLTGEIIHRCKDEYARADDFVGHIGGDDFVLITSPELAGQVCESIISEFDAVIPGHYSTEDRERGYIECRDRYGVERRFALMSVSIAVVSDAHRTFNSPVEIAEVATEIKDYVKSLPGSNYLIDRRTSPRWEE